MIYDPKISDDDLKCDVWMLSHSWREMRDDLISARKEIGRLNGEIESLKANAVVECSREWALLQAHRGEKLIHELCDMNFVVNTASVDGADYIPATAAYVRRTISATPYEPPPIVAGGQGRSAKSIKDSTIIVGVCFAMGLLCLFLWGVFG